MLNSSFKEASENKLKIDHVKSESVKIFLNLLTQSEKTEEISDVEILFEVDDLLQTYMIEPQLRANFQKQFWPILKGTAEKDFWIKGSPNKATKIFRKRIKQSNLQ